MNSIIYTKMKNGEFEPYDLVYVKKYIEEHMKRLSRAKGIDKFLYPSSIHLALQTIQHPRFSAYESIGDMPLSQQVKTTHIDARLVALIGIRGMGRDDISFVVDGGEALRSRLEKCGQAGKTQLVERIRDIIDGDLKFI